MGAHAIAGGCHAQVFYSMSRGVVRERAAAANRVCRPDGARAEADDPGSDDHDQSWQGLDYLWWGAQQRALLDADADQPGQRPDVEGRVDDAPGLGPWRQVQIRGRP